MFLFNALGGGWPRPDGKDEIVDAANEILSIDVDGGIAFEHLGIEPIREKPALNHLWDNYTADNKCIGTLAFHEGLDTVEEVASLLDP